MMDTRGISKEGWGSCEVEDAKERCWINSASARLTLCCAKWNRFSMALSLSLSLKRLKPTKQPETNRRAESARARLLLLRSSSVPGEPAPRSSPEMIEKPGISGRWWWKQAERDREKAFRWKRCTLLRREDFFFAGILMVWPALSPSGLGHTAHYDHKYKRADRSADNARKQTSKRWLRCLAAGQTNQTKTRLMARLDKSGTFTGVPTWMRWDFF